MRRVEFAVIGGGLIGTLLAQRLRDRGRELAWFDVPTPERGSNAPVALVHPFVGRSFAPRPELLSAWARARAWLEGLPREAGVHRAMLRRVLSDSAGAERLRRSFARAQGDVRAGVDVAWVHRGGTQAIEYGPAYAFELPQAVRALSDTLERAGTVAIPQRVQRLEPRESRWVATTAADRWLADHIIVAAGVGSLSLLREHDDVAILQRFEGHLLHAPGPPLDPFIIDGGHVSSSRTRWTWGSSFRELGRPDARDPAQQLEAIERKLSRWLSLPTPAECWRGLRLTVATHRHPWVETIQPGLHVCSAFGSKGTLWGPWLTERLVERLVPKRSP